MPLWRRAVPISAAVVVSVALTGTAAWFITRPAPPRVERFSIEASGAAELTINGNDRDLAVTPDGTRIVYVGNNGTQLFVRALDQLDPAPLTTGGVLRAVFIAPDGQWVGFVENNTILKKMALTGGPSVTIATMDGASRGATWGEDDVMIFATINTTTGLQRVSGGGGPVTALTRPDRSRGEGDHLWPEMLSGSRAVVFTITATAGGLDAAQIAVLDLASGTQKILLRGGSHAHYVSSGHLVYTSAGTLRAVGFDLDRLETRGTPVPVLPRLATTPNGSGDFGVAADGTLVYADAAGAGSLTARTLLWVDRQGREQPVAVPPRAYVYPRVSPDGTRVALYIADQEQDIGPSGPATVRSCSTSRQTSRL
jgi:serine/threonine-protein kinase